MQTFLAAQQARRNYRFKYRAQRSDQQYRVLIDYGRPRLAADGTFIGYVGSVTDITEHDEHPTNRPRASCDFGAWPILPRHALDRGLRQGPHLSQSALARIYRARA
jgi:hypothetical protein